MSKLEQAARQALEALDTAFSQTCSVGRAKDWKEIQEAITALRDALAEQVHTPYCKQAPMCKTPCGNSDCVEQAEQEPVGNNDWKSVSYIRETLNAEQAEQEPVAERFEKMHANGDVWITTLAASAIARNAAPVRTVDLTDEDLEKIYDEICRISSSSERLLFRYGRAVIAADREKNK